MGHRDSLPRFSISKIRFQNLPRGKEFPLWRIKASLKMPAFAYLLGDGHVVGMGAADRAEVPLLVQALRGHERDLKMKEL